MTYTLKTITTVVIMVAATVAMSNLAYAKQCADFKHSAAYKKTFAEKSLLKRRSRRERVCHSLGNCKFSYKFVKLRNGKGEKLVTRCRSK